MEKNKNAKSKGSSVSETKKQRTSSSGTQKKKTASSGAQKQKTASSGTQRRKASPSGGSGKSSASSAQKRNAAPAGQVKGTAVSGKSGAGRMSAGKKQGIRIPKDYLILSAAVIIGLIIIIVLALRLLIDSSDSTLSADTPVTSVVTDSVSPGNTAQGSPPGDLREGETAGTPASVSPAPVEAASARSSAAGQTALIPSTTPVETSSQSASSTASASGKWDTPMDRYHMDENFWQGCPERDVQLLTPNEYSRPQTELHAVNDIVIHYVDQPGSSAQANRDFFESLKDTQERSASSHFIIDMDGTIIQCVPLGEVAYASNQRNGDTLSIENCHPDDSGKFTDETYSSCVDLAAWLCYAFEITPDHVIRHYDVTEKLCPIYYVENPEAWEQMKKDIAERYAYYETTYGKRI